MNDNQIILLRTSKVLITDAVDNFHLVYAVPDSEYQTSAITLVCVKQLGLNIFQSRVEVIDRSSDKASIRGVKICQMSFTFEN